MIYDISYMTATTSLIVIENATSTDYTLMDATGHVYCVVKSNGYYYLKLPKGLQYILIGTFSIFNLWVDGTGYISRYVPDTKVHLEVHDITQQPPEGIDPLCNTRPKTLHHNKLIITPIDQPYTRVTVPVIQYLL